MRRAFHFWNVSNSWALTCFWLPCWWSAQFPFAPSNNFARGSVRSCFSALSSVGSPHSHSEAPADLSCCACFSSTHSAALWRRCYPSSNPHDMESGWVRVQIEFILKLAGFHVALQEQAISLITTAAVYWNEGRVGVLFDWLKKLVEMFSQLVLVINGTPNTSIRFKPDDLRISGTRLYFRTAPVLLNLKSLSGSIQAWFILRCLIFS